MSSLIEKLSSVSDDKKLELQQQGTWLYQRYFESIEKITLTYIFFFFFQPLKLNGNLVRTPYVIPYVQVEPIPVYVDSSFQSMRVNEPTLIDYVKKQM